MADDSFLWRMTRRIPPPGIGGILVLALAYAAGIAASNLMFDLNAVTALACVTLLTLILIPGGPPAGWTITVAAIFSAVVLVLRIPSPNVATTDWFNPAVVFGVALCFAVALVALLRRRQWIVLLTLAGVAVGFALIILGGIPLIDVWIILRDSADGLLAGRNPYEMTFPDVPPGQTADCFNYLPGTFLLTAPAQWLFGDVRWLIGGCLFATIAWLAWLASDGGRDWRDGRLPLVLLLGVLPGTLRVVQQSWNEPILLLGLVGGAILLERHRPNWAIVPIALALATKQHVVILLPLLLFWPAFGWRRVVATAAVAGAICLPWFLADPGRFYGCTVAFYTSTPFRAGSVSAWQLIPELWRLPALALALVAAYAIVLRKVPRSGSGLLMGWGAILMTFDLMNKQTFLNQWILAVELILAGLAIAGKPHEHPAERPELP